MWPGVQFGVDVEALRRFRAMKDEFFATDPSSPLTPPQRAGFRGLAYFPPNPELVVEAEIRAYGSPPNVDLVTSCGDTERYRRAGAVWFEVAGVPAAIMLFRSGRGELFVPFRDSTSGTETYGAGRYLEARSLEDGRAILDFNYAYNPYCAYSPEWRCPIPPIENHLTVPIRAGEMRYRDAEPPATANAVKRGIVAHLRRPLRARG
ncbi:MAG TPA: DUF1684 domain-containing protein [Actinomycetota bacterium]|nr:DUF1684 domain-containing protein [Actinomycetota bacterium]